MAAALTERLFIRAEVGSPHGDRDGSPPLREPLPTLAAADRQALYQLTKHCRDRGTPIAAWVKSRLRALDLIGADGIAPEDVRQDVLRLVRGQGLRMIVGGMRAPASKGSGFEDRILDLVER